MFETDGEGMGHIAQAHCAVLREKVIAKLNESMQDKKDANT